MHYSRSKKKKEKRRSSSIEADGGNYDAAEHVNNDVFSKGDTSLKSKPEGMFGLFGRR